MPQFDKFDYPERTGDEEKEAWETKKPDGTWHMTRPRVERGTPALSIPTDL
jgi:hypothetical protein